MRIARYETIRQCGAAGSAPSSCRGPSSGSEEPHGSSGTRRSRRVERETLETSLEARGRRGVERQAEPWSSFESLGRAKTTVGRDRAGRSAPGGLRYGLVDLQTRGGSDSPTTIPTTCSTSATPSSIPFADNDATVESKNPIFKPPNSTSDPAHSMRRRQ